MNCLMISLTEWLLVTLTMLPRQKYALNGLKYILIFTSQKKKI